MEKKHGPWTIKDSKEKYRHALIAVREDAVIRPNGEPGAYAVVRFKDGVEVLALDDEGYVHLAREFRYALGRESIEAVGGGIDEGEKPEDAARRELEEELNLTADELIELGTVHPITSLIESSSVLYLARRLRPHEREGDVSERIETVRMPFAEAVEKALNGEFTHTTTCVLILRAQHYLRTSVRDKR